MDRLKGAKSWDHCGWLTSSCGLYLFPANLKSIKTSFSIVVQSSGNLWSQWAGGRLCGLLWSTFRSHFRASLVAQLVKNPPAMQETLVWFLGLIPGEQIGYSLQYFGLENSLDCIVHGVTESRTQLSDLHSLTFRSHTVSFFNPLVEELTHFSNWRGRE